MPLPQPKSTKALWFEVGGQGRGWSLWRAEKPGVRRGRSGALYDRDGSETRSIHRRDAQAEYHMAGRASLDRPLRAFAWEASL